MGDLNNELAEAFELLSKYKSLENENFKAQAYSKAAQTLRGLGKPVTEFEKLDGIGSSISGKIQEYVKTGKIELLEKHKAELPLSVFEMTQLTGIGPKKAVKLFHEYGVRSLKELRGALDKGQIVDEKLKAAFVALVDAERVPYSYIHPIVLPILEDIRTWPSVLRAEFAGSMRRMKATIGDVDIIVASSDPKSVHLKFAKSEGTSLSSGPTKSSSFVETNGRQYRVDLLVTAPDWYGTALNYFTGDVDHNIALRSLAKSRGLKINEYGIWDANNNRVDKPGMDDHSLYEVLGLPYHPPRLRNGRMLLTSIPASPSDSSGQS